MKEKQFDIPIPLQDVETQWRQVQARRRAAAAQAQHADGSAARPACSGPRAHRTHPPHGGYENTIVYPAFREQMGPQKYAELAKRWAERERALRSSFDQYNRVLDWVEDALGIGLAQSTATTPKPRRSE